MKKDRISSMFEGSSFALIGAGQLGAMSVALWPDRIPKPLFFIDQNRSGSLMDIPIRNSPGNLNETPVYLLSAFKLKYNEIINLFKSISQDEILTVYDLLEEYCPKIFTNGWRNLDPPVEVLSAIQHSRECFEDHKSATIYKYVTRWRFFRSFEDNPFLIDEKEKYLVPEEDTEVGFDTILDCGSFDLGFHDDLTTQGVHFKNYVAFEPDDINFLRVKKKYKKFLKDKTPTNFSVYNSGVSSDSREMFFTNSGILASRFLKDSISNEVLSKKTVHSIDTFYGPKAGARDRLLIKLHVEGSEFDAIVGARGTLLSNDTLIFINLSHDEKSLLEIPPLLKALGFRLQLRCHSHFGEGLTLVGKNY